MRRGVDRRGLSSPFDPKQQTKDSGAMGGENDEEERRKGFNLSGLNGMPRGFFSLKKKPKFLCQVITLHSLHCTQLINRKPPNFYLLISSTGLIDLTWTWTSLGGVVSEGGSGCVRVCAIRLERSYI